MKKLVILLISILLFQNSYAQIKVEDQNSKFSLLIRGGLLYTDLYNPTFHVFRCIEGCWPEEQDGVTGKFINIGLAYQMNEGNQLAVLTGYSEFGYYERGFVSPGSGYSPYEVEKIWEFWGLEIEHTGALYRRDRVSLLLGNGMRFETPLDNGTRTHNFQVLKNIGISYNGRLGAEYRVSRKLFFVVNGLFKTSLIKYNKAEPVPEHNDYKPYGIGGEIGIKVKL